MTTHQHELAKTIFAAMMLRYGRWAAKALIFGLGIIGLIESCRYLINLANMNQAWAIYLAGLLAFVVIMTAMVWKEAKEEAEDRLACHEEDS